MPNLYEIPRTMTHRAFCIGLLLCYVCLNAYSQGSLPVKSAESNIEIDGYLEKSWNDADSISSFIQLEPTRDAMITRSTIVKILQDTNNIYFAFICYLEDKNEIAARIQRRDQLSDSDDIISILLDTYGDNRTAMLFQVNPLGTISDAKVTDDGKNLDYLWDTEWTAKTSVEDNYWIVEVKIPFKSIQYKPGKTVWGANFSRVIRANQETAWWSPVSENNRISQSGKLKNIQPLNTRKHHLSLFPYGTLRYENSDVTQVYNKLIPDAGIDLEYKYSSNFKTNLTYNPDFATVEGDKERINLTPWELSYPEKRLFFQDGNEMFKTRIQTFYSRRIGDIDFGGKVTGKFGKNQFNALTAKTKADEEENQSQAWFNTFRYKRDVLKSSSIGLTYADKIVDTASFRSLGLDYILNLGKTWKFTGQFVGSSPGDLLSHSAWFVRFARENNIYHYHIRYSNIGNSFRENVNETGFITDDDRHELDGDINYKFWINNSIRYWYLSSKNNIYWSQLGTLRSWYLTYGGRVYFKNRLSLDAYYNNEYKLLDSNYYNYYYQVKAGYNTDEASHAEMSYLIGRNFNRDFHLLEFGTRFNLFSRLTLSYEFNYLKYDPDPENNSTIINILGMDYFFTKDLWIRIFAQNNSQNNRIYLYGLAGWRFKPPFGAMYLILNMDTHEEIPGEENLETQIVFFKLTYPITIL